MSYGPADLSYYSLFLPYFVIKFFAGLFSSGYVPPDALNWSDGDNNANFHSKSIVMTPNPSLSIPAYHYFETPDNYFNKSATI